MKSCPRDFSSVTFCSCDELPGDGLVLRVILRGRLSLAFFEVFPSREPNTQETVALYGQLENERGRILFEFGLIYLGFALILAIFPQIALWLPGTLQ